MSGGETSYYGFEYQIYASVLLMLIEHQITNFVEFTIETDFGNDAEAIIERLETLESEDLKIFDLVVDGRNSSKQIQIKTKTPAYLWQPNELREALLKKDESCSSTEENADLLEFLRENEDQIFIFVTNGRVNRKLSGLLANRDYID